MAENIEVESEAAKRRKAEKEAQKQEKLKKLADKKAKLAAASTPNAAKAEKKQKSKAVQWTDPTKPGEKKILGSLDDPAHAAYTSSVVESSWNAWWEKEGFFQPEFDAEGKPKSRGIFVIPIPPPNVTGALHCGHAMSIALQDLMCRWQRMRGFTTLYLPGCDHASISTQAVVENMLMRKEGKTRHDLGREKFLERALEWKNEYAAKINNALRRLGGSLDWTREAYTMDPNLTAAVMEAFVQLYEQGLIYRDNRLVNWCTKLNTAVSNLEVDNKELKGRTLLDVPGYDKKVEFGVITHFKYQIEGSDETIEVATTRPETMLGDTGIAVHPNDERYKHLVGKNAKHPFIDRLMPIVADDYVDAEFGTGAVKITPAHDPNDFALGKRHKLEFINILNDNGTLNNTCGDFSGQKRFDARYTVVQKLEEVGLFVKKENNPMKVPLCNKSKDVIEPLMRPQWWMSMREVADESIKAVRDGKIKIRPESQERNYYSWLENINDWCLSRQLWWGHQVPAWRVVVEGGDPEKEEWIVARNEAEAEAKAASKFASQKYTLIQDADVLDTWFSSGLWPFATLGWPKQTSDMQHLFPTSVLETGWDIIFFWVARMIMLSIKLTGQVPFREVYCHSLIRDSEGRKMSKSLGNVVDPIDVMDGISLDDLNAKLLVGNLDPKELATATKYQKTAFPQGMPECGSDALRFTLIQYTTGGGDIALDIKVIAANRRFCNKIYQATKYVLGKLPSDFVPRKDSKMTGKETLAEKWILHNLAVAAREINQALAIREFSKTTQIVYAFWYEQLCDVFIENSKAIIQDGAPEEKESAVNTLYTALEGALTLLHPFMPFLSEELWQRLPRRPEDKCVTIVRAAYPEDLPFENAAAAAEYEVVLRTSKGIRSLMAEYDLKTGGKAFIHASEQHHKTASAELPSIRSLSGKGIDSITVLGPSDAPPSGCAVFVAANGLTVYLEVRGRVTTDNLLTSAKAKQEKALETIKKQKALISGPDFKDKVSEAVQELEEQKLKDAEAEERSFAASIEQFEKMKLDE